MVHKKICVLVVEDDPRVLRLEQMVLEKEGYSVVSVESGEEALEVLAEISPSLMILDVGLPGTDGFIACQRIREFLQYPSSWSPGKILMRIKCGDWNREPTTISLNHFHPMNWRRGLKRRCGVPA
jgi:CheY-like chemotaxis protein